MLHPQGFQCTGLPAPGVWLGSVLERHAGSRHSARLRRLALHEVAHRSGAQPPSCAASLSFHLHGMPFPGARSCCCSTGTACYCR